MPRCCGIGCGIRPTSCPGITDSEILAETANQVSDAPAELPDDAPLSFSAERFENWLIAAGIPWPRLPSGALALDDDTFRQMAKTHPRVAPLRELRHTLGEMRLFEDLAVGPDGRNRCLLSPFRARSSRNAPSNAKFIFGPVLLAAKSDPAGTRPCRGLRRLESTGIRHCGGTVRRHGHDGRLRIGRSLLAICTSRPAPSRPMRRKRVIRPSVSCSRPARWAWPTGCRRSLSPSESTTTLRGP